MKKADIKKEIREALEKSRKLGNDFNNAVGLGDWKTAQDLETKKAYINGMVNAFQIVLNN